MIPPKNQDPKDVMSLAPEPVNVRLYGKRDTTGVIKLRIKIGRLSWYFRRAQCNHKGVQSQKEAEESEPERAGWGGAGPTWWASKTEEAKREGM